MQCEVLKRFCWIKLSGFYMERDEFYPDIVKQDVDESIFFKVQGTLPTATDLRSYLFFQFSDDTNN